MKVSEMLIGLTLFCGIMIGMSNFYIDVHNTYNVSYTSNRFNSTTFNYFDSINATVSKIEYQINHINVDPTIIFDLGILFWETVKLFLQVPKLFFGLIETSVGFLMLPAWVTTMLSIVIIVAVVFVIVKIVFKVEV